MSIERPHDCGRMKAALTNPAVPMAYDDGFREYAIEYLDEGPSLYEVLYCPFCGAELPSSVRSTWFQQLRSMGLEPGDDGIPADMQTGKWWRDAGL